VYCDLALNAHLKVASGDSVGTPEALPRRVASKNDASGDALCAPCLDTRLQRRREEFLRPHGRRPDPEVQPAVSSASRTTAASLRSGAPTKPLDPPVRRFSSVRIERVRPMVKSTAGKPLRKPLDQKRVIAEALAEVQRAATRASHAKALQAQMRSLQLMAAEIGLLRAHELLAQIRAAALDVAERSR